MDKKKIIILIVIVAIVSFVLGIFFLAFGVEQHYECISYVDKGDWRGLICVVYVRREYREMFLPRFVIGDKE